ncbi:uncharacterized protein LOC123516168 [Portunus trituberculatus]|uniref:uncharacterized protein LOC123516168 n=1 Tax=Portunus trituberculatus TaxID=210409 RepID=UPI001E1CC6AC|nr:uncharacterized protein LOC123516168 [Portunus trituberculatus]
MSFIKDTLNNYPTKSSESFTVQASLQPTDEQTIIINEGGTDESFIISPITSHDLAAVNTHSYSSSGQSTPLSPSSITSTPMPSPSSIPKTKKKRRRNMMILKMNAWMLSKT